MFWRCFGVLFGKNFICPVFDGGSSLRNVFRKSKKIQIFKNAQNRSQKCPNMFWTSFGVIFPKSFLPSVAWRVESSKCFQKIKKLSKFKKSPKSFPKVSKRVLNLFWGNFSEKKIFAQCSMGGRVFEMFLKKKFQNCKKAQSRSQKCPNVFWTCFGVIF